MYASEVALNLVVSSMLLPRKSKCRLDLPVCTALQDLPSHTDSAGRLGSSAFHAIQLVTWTAYLEATRVVQLERLVMDRGYARIILAVESSFAGMLLFV